MLTVSEAKRKTNLRSTEQRETIRQILQQADEHLDADAIYQRARLKSPSISLSTVYRNLQLFKKVGLVEEHQFGNRRYYESTSLTKHHHLVCLNCGHVLEFECPSTEKLKLKINKEEGFMVIETEVHLAGYCAECQEYLSANKDTSRT